MTTSTATTTLRPVIASNQSPRQVRRIIVAILTYGVLIAVALATVMPFVYSIVNSFKHLPDINANPQLLYPTTGWAVDGYNQIFGSSSINFFRSLFNSVLVSVAVTLAHLTFDSMAGYALARIHFPGRRFAFAALIGTLMVPAIVLLIPRYLVLQQLSLLNTYLGLILPNLADAFGIFLMKQFFESIPAEIEEAAFIDGSSRFRMFFVIIIPMALPALTALAIFGFQGSWNDFTGPLITVVSKKELYTLPLALAFIRGDTGAALYWDQLLAGAVVTTLPMALVFFIFQRFFIEGVTYTGVKG